MNNKKRSQIEEADGLLARAIVITESVMDNEQDCIDNMPENLQYSDKYEKMEEAVEHLRSAIEYIENARESLSEAKE